MERDNKILLGAVLILLVAMLSFNFNSITGKVTASNKAAVRADPSSVYFSADDLANRPTKVVSVKVTVSSGSVENNLQLYRSSGERMNGKTRQLCGSKSECKKGTYQVDFKMGAELEDGEYYFAVQGDRERFEAENVDESAEFSRDIFKSNMVTIDKYIRPFYGG